jgi:hypothetical protein
MKLLNASNWGKTVKEKKMLVMYQELKNKNTRIWEIFKLDPLLCISLQTITAREVHQPYRICKFVWFHSGGVI